jgi:hypothetical protein
MLRGVWLLVAASGLCAQTDSLERLKSEVARVKALSHEKADGEAANLHRVLRDWIESRLPGDKGLLHVAMPRAEAVMRSELKEAGLEGEDSADGEIGFGYVEVAFKQLPELPNTLLVTAGVSVPCGVDEAVYLYQFDATSRTRVLENRPLGYGSTYVELSQPDGEGRRLLLTTHLSVQCASFWMGMAYSVHRFGMLPGVPEKLLSVEHGFYLDDNSPSFELTPDGLVVEFLHSAVDVDYLIRTHIYKYDFTVGVHRRDPVALQPQDFVEEWLTRSWAEMQLRSAAKTKDMYDQLHADFVRGHYDAVKPCAARPGLWSISLDLDQIGEKELAEPRRTYFLVRELSKYRYRMETVSEEEPTGCPGKGVSLETHPWLTPAEIRAIPKDN